MTLVENILVFIGSIFILAAAVGVFRFPDFYTRLHAATKLVTLGMISIMIAAALFFSSLVATSRALLIISFFFLTAPLSAYMIARSGYLRGLPMYKEAGSKDEWDACGAAVKAENAASETAQGD